MRTTLLVFSALVSVAVSGVAGCSTKSSAAPHAETPVAALPVAAPMSAMTEPAPAASTRRQLFLDVHDLGPGKVTAGDVAQAHAKDLATEGKYDVSYKAYWVDEKQGKIYCLAEAPSADAANTVHEKAHGLLAKAIMEVTADSADWKPTPGARLFMDVHHLGAGKVTAEDVAAAHQKDLAAGAKHGVKYLNYWFDAASGTVLCLSEAPSAEAAIAVHREAHGLIPDSIEEVIEGR